MQVDTQTLLRRVSFGRTTLVVDLRVISIRVRISDSDAGAEASQQCTAGIGLVAEPNLVAREVSRFVGEYTIVHKRCKPDLPRP